MIQLGAEDGQQVRVIGLAGSVVTTETDAGRCQCAGCQHLSAARGFKPRQRSEFAVGIKRGIAQSCELTAGCFDSAFYLAELGFAVVHKVTEMSNTDSSGKPPFPELFTEQTRFVIHLVTLRAVAWDRPRATPLRICYAADGDKGSWGVSRFLSRGTTVAPGVKLNPLSIVANMIFLGRERDQRQSGPPDHLSAVLLAASGLRRVPVLRGSASVRRDCGVLVPHGLVRPPHENAVCSCSNPAPAVSAVSLIVLSSSRSAFAIMFRYKVTVDDASPSSPVVQRIAHRVMPSRPHPAVDPGM